MRAQGCLAGLGPRKHAQPCPPQLIGAPHARRNGLCCPGEGCLGLTSLPSSQDTQDSAKEPGTNSGASAFRGLLERGMARRRLRCCLWEKDQKALMGLQLVALSCSGLRHEWCPAGWSLPEPSTDQTLARFWSLFECVCQF